MLINVKHIEWCLSLKKLLAINYVFFIILSHSLPLGVNIGSSTLRNKFEKNLEVLEKF